MVFVGVVFAYVHNELQYFFVQQERFEMRSVVFGLTTISLLSFNNINKKWSLFFQCDDNFSLKTISGAEITLAG